LKRFFLQPLMPPYRISEYDYGKRDNMKSGYAFMPQCMISLCHLVVY